MNTPRFFAAFGKGDFIKYQGKRLGFWDVIGSGITPYGYIYSLAYQHAVFPDPTIPLFGDCGAWTYRKQDTPTLFQDIVDAQWAIRSYQKRLHPNQETYVTAPDHILFANLSRCQREARREFNWINARNFLELAKTQLPHTTPVAVAHGLSVCERIRAALDLIKLGYKLIGLGGLATIGNVSHALTIIQTVANQLHGVVHPQQILEPYECNPYKLTPFQRHAWCNKVINQLRAIAPLGAEFVILGGRQYYAGIIEPLEAAQLYTVTTPLAGLAIGRKMHWLKVNTPSFRQLSLGI